MKKLRNVLLCILMMVVTFQLLGIEQAFCDDSAAEAGCQDCVACVLNLFTIFSAPDFSSSLHFSGFAFSGTGLPQIEEPVFNFFRPPISL